ncbi:hypothetical protein A3E45_01370 [Candidatus Daviesbacteria bacterium RIFCSPHIGHO2_12_FULL_43_11]|uniref:Uncharacterized protein n=2 Tax=Candidatus Daviesiibacteriota TaxID=1752718 RepID=A0A1F5K741_9BACT|nr:MAG: hypothetical protein UV41_C0005G0011 [Candidatus Daviesbacteria bacterium GW2011_GWA2_42_7]OGE36757.1 MAG: hypothetical protein A3E45_01370 [Candidatus Daviesbacteria bacterium RIFCSPHIGHO2_12_FULL_43_11]
MKFPKVLIIIIFLGVMATFVIMSRTGSNKMVSPQIVSQNQAAATPTPTPTPVLININQSSNLETETKNLTPDDFSGDFKVLREEAGRF